MVEEKELGIKKNYEGSMDSKYQFSMDASRIGATTSPQVANQIGELNSRLNQGLRAVELGTMNQRLLDQVPKEHFTEIHRMAKLTGAEPSLHAPIQDLDLAGFTQQGWDPHQQKRSIKQLENVMDKAHLLDPKGNTPIVVHAGGSPVQKWEKKGLKERDEDGKVVDVKDERSEMGIINSHTGETTLTRYRERMMVGREGKIPFTPEDQLHARNKNQWDDEQFKLLQWKKLMDEREQMTNTKLVQGNYAELKEEEEKGILSKEGRAKLDNLNLTVRDNMAFKDETYDNMRMAVEDMYERFEEYPYKGDDTMESLEYKDYKENKYPKFKKQLEEGERKLEKRRDEYRDLLKENASDKDKALARQKYEAAGQKQTDNIIRAFQDMPAPQVWKPIDDFAQEKTSTSLAEAALYSYKKHGKNSPFIGLENVYPEFALSRADSLKKTIIEARKKFAKKLGNTKEAKEQAEKLIGATWDVGHIYMLKKSGYSDEDIKKESKIIAPFVKHIHLTDNFGFEDSHLPPGLGDVNIKDQLREIEKSQGKEGFKKLRGIVEAGEFVANYKETPHLYALSHLGSPMYTEDAGPQWDKAWDTHGSYLGGYGEMMPQKYFDLYGAPGFSQLPAALGGGGQGGGDKGRFASATPSEETEE